LQLMERKNSSRHSSAFTLSIEAVEGISTGISAADRARTVAVATDPTSTAADIASPGHIFPLRARDGGVLVRAGHTEAAVDVSRLAGLNPSGVICEVMNDDGTMARLPDLIKFGQKHGIKIGTISDLIAYRRKHDSLVRERSVKAVTSVHGGEWLMRVYTDELQGADQVVLTKGDLTTPEPVLVRVHALNPLEDVLGLGAGSDLGGAVILLRDTTMKMVEDGEHSPQTLRQYGLGAEILAALGLSKVTLVTNSAAPKMVGIEGYDLTIAGTRAIKE